MGCRAATLAAIAPALAGCAGELSALDPAGPAAAEVAVLWWVMLAGAAAILAGVMGAALYALKAERGGRDFSARRVLIGWGLVFPTLTMGALLAFALIGGERLIARGDGDDTIRVTARQWSWVVDYPGGQRTIGVVHVPAGRDFTIALTSEDVIHSFWAPRLGGKMDAIPGKENRIRLHAGEPGVYHGLCAEYCGIGHALMPFEVHAHAPAAYDAALAADAAPEGLDNPVLNPREAPAAGVIGRWADYLRDWLGRGAR